MSPSHDAVTFNMDIKAVIVEDSNHSLQKLECLLKDFDYIDVIGQAREGHAAIELINSKKPDLVFLDIQLPGINGFQVLKYIKHHPYVIFITAHDQYAVKAFEEDALDYILKPVSRERLKKAIEKVVKQDKRLDHTTVEVLEQLIIKRERKVRFPVKKDDGILIVPQEEVYYFKAEDKYVFICTYDQCFFYNSTIKALSLSLDPGVFCIINKSYIVALDKIIKLKRDYLREYKVILKDKKRTALKVSRNHLAVLKEKLYIQL